jgi:uncharacterized protein YodC (DUF2158 family)
MAINFKVGDVVRLKSGGPDMTVNAVGVGICNDQVYCVWFDGKKKGGESFPPEALEAVEPKAKRTGPSYTLVSTKKGL